MRTALRRVEFTPALRDRATAGAIAILMASTWEWVATAGWINPSFFPPPSRILTALLHLAHTELATDLRYTIVRLAAGFLIGATSGIVLGLVMGVSARMMRIVDPFIAAVHPIPKIVLFPLFIVIFGIGDESKIASIALTVFFPTLINSAAGTRQVPQLYHEVVRGYGGKRMAILRHVVLPGSLPFVLNGIRIALNLGLLVTVAMEFTVVSPGIGSIIWISLQTMRIEELYAGIVVISIVGVTLNMPVQWLLRRTARWQ